MSEQEAAASSAVEGNQQKFAWIYALLGDTDLSTSAKTVGIGTALKMAGRKGYFKATRKAIASLCGVSPSTVDRSFVELAGQKYWDIDYKIGAANIYTLIMPDRRLEMWLAAETEYRWLCKKWLFEEGQAIRAWLAAERAYKSRIEWAKESRSKPAGDATGPAIGGGQVSEACVPDDEGARHIRGGVSSGMTRGLTKGDERGSSGLTRGLVTADPLTSGDAQTHKSLESTLKVPERDLKVPRNDDGAPSAPDGTPSARTARCELCDDNGIFIDPHGYPVVLLENTEDDDFAELNVECKHSVHANLAEIQRIEQESNGYWGASKTGWKEIDEHYGFDDYDDGDDLI